MSAKGAFFRQKQSWSQIKDDLLSAYLTPYLAKMAYRRNPILVADCFAGKGRFDDGEPGSPELIYSAIEDQKERSPQAVIKLVCIERQYYAELVQNMSDKETVTCLDGDYEERMAYFLTQYDPRGQDLLLYVDPYGIKSIRFSHFDAVSNKGFGSVELLLNLNTFGFLREGCRLLKNSALREADEEEDAPVYEPDVNSIQLLDEIAGGDFWQAIIDQYYARNTTFREAEARFSAGYCERLKGVFAYSLSMPIKTKISNIPKYRIVYGTNHPHGLILMSDNMFRRWQEFKECDRKGQMVLFDLDYPETLVETSSAALKQAIVECAA
ncbi:MAG: three-Cys-motif partner protein TcmP [Kiritimatiellia bacterium]